MATPALSGSELIEARHVFPSQDDQCVSRSFTLINQRQPVAFALFRNISQAGNFSEGAIVARSPIIKFANYNEPTQGHLALTGTAGCASHQTPATKAPESSWRFVIVGNTCLDLNTELMQGHLAMTGTAGCSSHQTPNTCEMFHIQAHEL